MMSSPHAVTELQRLFGAIRRAREPEGLEGVLEAGAAVIAALGGYGTAVVNVYRPVQDDFVVAVVVGSQDAREKLLGDAGGYQDWILALGDLRERQGAYFSFGPGSGLQTLPEFRPAGEGSPWPAAWHPDDLLLVPVRDEAGRMLGIVSVDEPIGGMRPSDEQLQWLVALCKYVGLGLQASQEIIDARRHAAALGALAMAGVGSGPAVGGQAWLERCCAVAARELGFGAVAVETVNGEGLLSAVAGAGTHEAPPLGVDRRGLQRVLDEGELREGCVVITRQRHERLLVSLLDDDGAVLGVLRADAPDGLLPPSPARLRALCAVGRVAARAMASPS
jgi:hypothetical protein